MAGIGIRGAVAVLAVLALVLAGGIAVARRSDGPSAPATRASGVDASAGVVPDPVVTLAPEPSTTTVVAPTTLPPTTRPVATPPTTGAPVLTTVAPATTQVTSVLQRPKPDPTTWSANMNGIGIRLRITPDAVIAGRQFVEFAVDLTSSLPRCCTWTIRFSDAPDLFYAPTPTSACNSGGTPPTSGKTSRRFTSAGTYTVSLVASTCLAPPDPNGASTGPPVSTSATLQVCLRVLDLTDATSKFSVAAGAC